MTRQKIADSRKQILDLINHTRSRVQRTPSLTASSAIAEYRARFDAASAVPETATLNVFVFHAEVPDSHRRIAYVDVHHDHGEFDYRGLTSHLIWASRAFNDEHRVHIFLVTDETSKAPEPCADLTVVRLPIDARAVMLERVHAMNAYVHSRAFRCNTVFLDTDAYPNRPLGEIFERNTFDIGVTLRTTPGFMPLNEGVIFASAARAAPVRRFFDSYLATYEALRADSVVTDYYGNIDRWRGGQLALNAVACPAGDLRTIRRCSSTDVEIRMFPCNEFNYWVTRETPVENRGWNRKFILHLKGDSKVFLPSVAQYQRRRADALRNRPGVEIQ
jgi:hypothetical protein